MATRSLSMTGLIWARGWSNGIAIAPAQRIVERGRLLTYDLFTTRQMKVPRITPFTAPAPYLNQGRIPGKSGEREEKSAKGKIFTGCAGGACLHSAFVHISFPLTSGLTQNRIQ